MGLCIIALIFLAATGADLAIPQDEQTVKDSIDFGDELADDIPWPESAPTRFDELEGQVKSMEARISELEAQLEKGRQLEEKKRTTPTRCIRRRF